MSVPPIEIRWGGGKWPSNRKRTVRPILQAGLEIAECALSELGVVYRAPKIATVWCTGVTWPDEGGAEVGNSTNFELYLPHRDVKRRKVSRWLPALVVSSVHEMLHLVREETSHDTESLAGRVADEGLANYGEFAVALDLLTPDELMLFYQRVRPSTDVSDLNPGVLDGLRQDVAYLDGLRSTPSYEVTAQRLENAWLAPQYDGALSAGECIGVSAVAAHVNAGTPFGDVMKMPSEQILGIE